MKAGNNFRSVFSESKTKSAVPDISKLIYECLNIKVGYTNSTSDRMKKFSQSPFGDIQINFSYFV